KIGAETSLRYAANLIAVASQLSAKRRAAEVDLADVKRAYTLFLDSGRSVQFVSEFASRFIDNDGNVTLGRDDDKMQTD
ncbi:hypothetical protein OXX59_010278, partial [Metschnikowia pulcherrima]